MQTFSMANSSQLTLQANANEILDEGGKETGREVRDDDDEEEEEREEERV